MNLNSNITTLLNSLGKSPFNGVDLTQYSLIKSGAYKKALNAYYAEDKTDKTQTESKTSKKEESVAKTANSVLNAKADTLSENLSKLSDEKLWAKVGTEDGRAAVNEAVKSFVKSYNDVIEQSGKVNSSDVKNEKTNMTGMTSAMTKYLAKAGVEVSAAGKLSVNEKALSSASAKDLQDIFAGNNSYGAQIKGYSDAIKKDTVTAATLYNGNGTPVSTLEGMFSSMI